MTFRYVNLSNTAPLSLQVTYKDEVITFTVNKLLDKTKKYQLDSPHQFELLEQYIEYKGELFKENVFKHIKRSYDVINDFLLEDTKLEFTNVIKHLLNMFDLDDIKQFILKLDYITPPHNLKDEFDETIVKDGIGTRVQTYTKDEYINLISYSLIPKLLIGPFGEYLFANQSTVVMQTKELSLIQMILDVDHIFKSPPVIKMIGSFQRTIETSLSTTEKSTIVIKRMISIDDIKYYLLGVATFKIIPVNMPRYDKASVNLITFIYSSTNDMLRPDNKIRKKIAKSDGDETESSLEIYRMSSSIMIAHVEEFKLFSEDPYMILKHYGIEDTEEVLKDALQFMQNMSKTTHIDINIIKLMIWVISITPDNGDDEIGTIDPEAIMYLDIHHIINLMSVAFTIVWYHGFKDIAYILASIIVNDDDVAIQGTLGKEKISKETLEELKKYYPIDKEVIGKNNVKTVTDLISLSINDMVLNFYKHTYRLVCDAKYLEGRPRILEIPNNLRDRIAQLLISLHKGINNDRT